MLRGNSSALVMWRPRLYCLVLQAITTGSGGTVVAGSEDSKKLSALMDSMLANSRNARALSNLRNAVETAALGGAYLLTGVISLQHL